MTKKEQMDWVEIVEPRTKEHMYANLTTGECVWDPPPGVKVKRTDDNQWWELFDQNTSRFYYYNASSQKTVWHKPQNCDIIPLAKLQTLKQNTEVSEGDANRASTQKESVSTQTSSQGAVSESYTGIEKRRMCSASTQTSPTSSPRESCHHYHHQHHHHRHSTSPCAHSNNTKSIHLLNPCHPQELDFSGVPLPSDNVANAVGHRRYESYYSSESAGSSTSQRQDYSPEQNDVHLEQRPVSKSLESNRRHRSLDHERGTVGTSWKHHSVDKQGNISKVNAPGSCPAPKLQPHRKHHSEDLSAKTHFFSTFHPTESIDIDYLDAPAGRQHSSRSCSRSTDSSMSSPQSPLLPNRDVQVVRGADGSLFAFSDVPQESSDSSPQSMDSARGLDSSFISQSSLMSLDSQQKSVSEPATSPNLRHLHTKSKNVSSVFEKDHGQSKSIHNRDGNEASLGTYYHASNLLGDHKGTATTQQNEQPTPLYSNLDYPSLWDTQPDHPTYLLPLQHYLLEQAKLSGYRFGDFIGDDLDSLSQSDEDSDAQHEEEDDFADDEAMSHQDSSSQEYLDDTRYLDDDDEEEVYCEPPPSFQEHSSSQLSNTQHSSLRRKNTNLISSHSPVSIEKSQSFQPDMGPCQSPRPLSMIASTEGSVSTNNVTGSLQKQNVSTSGSSLYKEKKQPSESDIEKYAQDNLNRHKKGIFRKKFTIQDMLSWSKDPIRKPMIMITDKSLKREACEIFKMIQMYMGDRKVKSGQTVEAVVLDIATKGWSRQAIRDEIFVQICRQTTDNPRRESLMLGWELMAICLTFFPPSVKFQPYLDGFISRHKDTSFDTPDFKLSHYAAVCSKRLERISKSGAKKGLRKPTLEEIEQSRVQIFRPSMFGNTLEEVMLLQKHKYPNRSLPWIQTTLSELVLTLNGAQTEGIFRVPGDIDEVNAMKLQIDQWEVAECNDPHVPASLLKLWYRELYEPLIPSEFYDECIQCCLEPVAAVNIVQKLPEINRLVLSYLIRFLQVFAAEQNAVVTKMDASNLAMVMAPNCLRCMSDDPRIIFENTRKEMAFVRMLIENLDTTYMEGIM